KEAVHAAEDDVAARRRGARTHAGAPRSRFTHEADEAEADTLGPQALPRPTRSVEARVRQVAARRAQGVQDAAARRPEGLQRGAEGRAQGAPRSADCGEDDLHDAVADADRRTGRRVRGAAARRVEGAPRSAEGRPEKVPQAAARCAEDVPPAAARCAQELRPAAEGSEEGLLRNGGVAS